MGWNQSNFLRTLINTKTPVAVIITNGFQIKGVITGEDKYAIFVAKGKHTQMVYKSAISTIDPETDLEPPKFHVADN